ncbi:uncharacterized protein MONOS_10157 [Monocercomonoides exilis]|uniref:uncharacterized protein n=1 Tax=Monocercomonoides exilis TaxID=2049356 RepID=UPI003559707C|nr:hypothetical protein MONOS_10157 [Monocercomonoides exilis]|eukprot:MONOS_10157.1-p1 / transcript=MONOS_10157.1 / gene=MONOS_10157 / organism=Monocercomonoides_exilis_PA203 / gene_product=unspecified product / transcript_product=unspecified product / location=Mono_scaffold00449:45757-47426(+) / protein_length=511 / sequence_SO=supercontig / SO=protein_coding / is_pseudo=false
MTQIPKSVTTSSSSSLALSSSSSPKVSSSSSSSVASSSSDPSPFSNVPHFLPLPVLLLLSKRPSLIQIEKHQLKTIFSQEFQVTPESSSDTHNASFGFIIGFFVVVIRQEQLTAQVKSDNTHEAHEAHETHKVRKGQKSHAHRSHRCHRRSPHLHRSHRNCRRHLPLMHHTSQQRHKAHSIGPSVGIGYSSRESTSSVAGMGKGEGSTGEGIMRNVLEGKKLRGFAREMEMSSVRFPAHEMEDKHTSLFPSYGQKKRKNSSRKMKGKRKKEKDERASRDESDQKGLHSSYSSISSSPLPVPHSPSSFFGTTISRSSFSSSFSFCSIGKQSTSSVSKRRKRSRLLGGLEHSHKSYQSKHRHRHGHRRRRRHRHKHLGGDSDGGRTEHMYEGLRHGHIGRRQKRKEKKEEESDSSCLGGKRKEKRGGKEGRGKKEEGKEDESDRNEQSKFDLQFYSRKTPTLLSQYHQHQKLFSSQSSFSPAPSAPPAPPLPLLPPPSFNPYKFLIFNNSSS